MKAALVLALIVMLTGCAGYVQMMPRDSGKVYAGTVQGSATGAGTMTTLLSLRAEYQTINIVIAVLINIIIVYAVLKSSSKIEKALGKNGLGVIRKVFGVILLAIAVKLFAANVKGLFV